MPASVRRVLFVLCGLAGVAGFWLGIRREPLDESAAIVAVVGRYVEETGGVETDCVARPGAGVWLEVICTRARYTVTRRGVIARVEGPQT
ncbi:MAG: hypothetical protein AAGM84_15330 [Pseudomonadota bacterium]